MKNFTIALMMFVTSFGIMQAQDFPMNFEGAEPTVTDFDGGVVTVIDNPQSSALNTSAKVAQMVKNAGQTWGGSKLALSGTIDFTTNQVFTMKVYSPRAGVPVLFKLENGDGSVATEMAVPTTKANEWEVLSYDFSGATSGVYNNIVFIFENGTMGDGSANWTFLFDDIEFSPSANPALNLPIDFEGGPYGFIDFDGGAATVIDNPQASGENTSAKVAQIIRNGGQIWGGSKLVLAGNLDFSILGGISMKVFTSAPVGTTVKFKLEGTSQTEVDVQTTVSGAWETLTWDFTGQPAATFNTLVFMFDFGNLGDGSANSTFLFDDVMQMSPSGGLSQIDLPVTFEDETVNYAVTDFGGNATVLGEDPNDASNTVAITTKTSGAEGWAGTTIGTAMGFATRIPFTEINAKISVKVYSPAAGVTVRLKAEDHRDATLTVETEATTTVANAWETLVFDMSQVATGTNPFNLATSFDKVSIFFNFGAAGAADVYYWDDVVFGVETAAQEVEAETVRFSFSNSQLHVHCGSEFLNGSIDVYDLTGRLLMNQRITNQYEMLVTNMTGILLIKVSDATGRQVITKKMIVR